MKKDKHLQKLINNLAKSCFKDAKIMESQVIKSIKILKMLPKSAAILALSQFLKEVKRRQRQHTMTIEALVPLSPTQIQKIKKIMEKKISNVIVNINPEILGGFRIKVGDEIWDESVLGKLSQVKEAIISS